MRKPVGLFITGNDTDVGKTFVGAMIARAVAAQGLRVGVYKPAASGCHFVGRDLICDDALALWHAAGSSGELERVCPQRFVAPLAPHLAARAEGKELNREQLTNGMEYWRERSEFILVEGAGGLMSPLGDDLYVVDLALALGYPLIVIAKNRIGVINQTLQTLIAARHFRGGLRVAGIVLNRTTPPDSDPSISDNRRQLELHCDAPVLADVGYGQTGFSSAIDWAAVATG
jgi:dethiobiotin synthetase